MRHVSSIIVLTLLAACTSATLAPCPNCSPYERGVTFTTYGGSTFNDYNDDGLPDDPEAAVLVDTDGDRVPDLSVRIGTLFVDTNDDGLPDTRVRALGGHPDGYVRASIARASMDVVRAADRQQLEAALDALATALADARRTLRPER
jgi:hypothetical protein